MGTRSLRLRNLRKSQKSTKHAGQMKNKAGKWAAQQNFWVRSSVATLAAPPPDSLITSSHPWAGQRIKLVDRGELRAGIRLLGG